MGHYNYLFCLGRVKREYIKTMSKLLSPKNNTSEFGGEYLMEWDAFGTPEAIEFNQMDNSGLPCCSNYELPDYDGLSREASEYFKERCNLEGKDYYIQTEYLWYPKTGTLFLRSDMKEGKPIWNFYKVADSIMDAYYIICDYEGEDAEMFCKGVSLNTSLREIFSIEGVSE